MKRILGQTFVKYSIMYWQNDRNQEPAR